MHYPIVVVHWDDAVDRGDGGGVPRHKPSRQILVGWLLLHDDEGITLAFEHSDEDNSWRNETFIPAGMIAEVYEIEFND